jgi:hypothetical protein
VSALEGQIRDAVAEGRAPVLPVKGTVTLTLQTPEGPQKCKVGIKPGRHRMRIATGEECNAEALLRIANGKEATPAELQTYTSLVGMTKDKAIAELTALATRGASLITLEKVK